ncbi:MAG: PLP-dependent aspartate aminotransferase family protein [candidate division Zixibacteria bacterium]|nr:PLP-dependent aspartate aminotransferase family protein [candidate division Zixibacteria bacterium]
MDGKGKRWKNFRFETKAIHSGQIPHDNTGGVTQAIFPSSTYRVGFPGDESGYVYSRWSNPTRSALEEILADLENGSHAFAFASGLSALNAVLDLLKSGDHVVAVDDLYGGTRRLFERLMRNFGLDFSYVDGTDPANFEKAVKPNTKLFWFETPTNPLLKLVDIKAVSAIAKKHNILTAVDNTFATPYIQRPLELGADIVHHSVSKYLGGHCDVIGGALVVNNEELAERLRFNQYAVGGVLDPFQAWLVIRGLKTLHLRMERHSVNAMKVVEYLETVDLVDKIYFPGIDGKAIPNGMTMPGGMLSFTIKADFETVKKFAMATQVFILAESLGGVESLINHPASMTHASIPKDVREANGITDGLVRLSVGVEHHDDLVSDLTNAFAAIKAVPVSR